MRLSLLVGLIALALLGSPSTVHAQWLAPAGVQSTGPAAAGSEPAATREISASKYVLRGALIGAVTLGAVALLAAVSLDQECLGCSPIIIAPIVLGTGAILGAAVGYVVYRARRS